MTATSHECCWHAVKIDGPSGSEISAISERCCWCGMSRTKGPTLHGPFIDREPVASDDRHRPVPQDGSNTCVCGDLVSDSTVHATLKCACQSLVAAGWKVTCAACGSKTGLAAVIWPHGFDEGLHPRSATPEEVDAGCELGEAYDPCPDWPTPPAADATGKVDVTQPVAFPVAPLAGSDELVYRLITLQALRAEATS